MAVQASAQHLQASIPSDVYAVDAPTSRRHYSQNSPAGDSYRSANSPQSSQRPSRRPSGNTPQSSNPTTPQPSQYRSPPTSQPSSASTARALPNPPTTHASPLASATMLSHPYQSTRREQRTEPDPSTGPPIPPPPRTSSNQRGLGVDPASGATLTDRTINVPSRDRSADDPGRSPRIANISEAQQREEAHQAVLAQYQRESEQNRPRDDAAAAAAAAARSRRRGPASPESPDRSSSTREPRNQKLPENIQSRSAAEVPYPTRPANLTREESEVINRVVVTDPVIDLAREKERLAEAVPVGTGIDEISGATLSLVGSEGVNDHARSAGRSRQDYSSSAARRKDTKFGEYMLGQTLGEGEFGKVKLGWKKDGSVQVAIKLIRRENLNTNPSRLPKIYREINILRGLSHPNIVRLHEMVETDRHIGIIMEYASGGELFDYILNHRYLKDNAARRLFAQLVSGVGYLHKKGIVHRDLKLENLLLDRNRNIIITDFGFANTFDPSDELGEEIELNLTNRDFVKRMDLERVRNGVRRGDLMQTSCGSPCYAAPELVVTDSLYTGRKVDVWSCGVILYAMLAGYLPFDDDPANPEGDNINLLYKYIVSTPLTFPEYVTPHARDLLRRILVPNPRERADLFEVARHSWLSDYAHVVAHVTSSTTTVGEIVNTTVPAEDHQDPPLLARSASVREPSKPHATNMSPVGGLSHQGKIDPEQSDKIKVPRDSKRRTVQVEYVAPQSQTTRGELSPTPSSAAHKDSPTAPQTSTRTRSGSQSQTDSQHQASAAIAARKPLPQEPSISQGDVQAPHHQAPLASNQTHQRPVTSQPGMHPPPRPSRDIPRSASDSTGAFGQLPAASTTRPNTSGSMASTGGGKLSSRGNSYSLPVAPTVAATNAQGKLAQPKNGRHYNISAPIPQPEPYISDASARRPGTQQTPTRYSQLPPPRDGPKAHKRSNTLGNIFGKSGSMFGGKSHPQSPQESARPEKRYPPTSMKAPIASNSPRQSTESRRPSFSFGRKNSDLSRHEKQDKSSRRFSLLPASFSFKTSASSSREQASDVSRPASQRKGSIGQQYQQPARGIFNQQPLVYGQGFSPSQSEENMPVYDGSRDRSRQASAPQPRYDNPQIRNATQPLSSQPPHFGSLQNAPYPQVGQSSRPSQPGQSYFISESGPPTDSEVSIGRPPQQRPQYPPGFDSYEEPPRPSMQQGRNGRGPGVLQKNTRKFADAYDQDHDPGHHAGSSGAAKRVMDFFRRRGRARAGDER